MLKFLFIIIFILSSVCGYSQLDSSVVYVNDTSRWKAIYEGTNSWFYKKQPFDTVWTLYGKWEDTENNRYFYSIDTAGLVNNYRVEWNNDIRYSYWIDTTGIEELVAYTKYYGTIPTLVTSTGESVPTDGISILINGIIVTLYSTTVINEIWVYDIEGRLLINTKPNKSEVAITTSPNQMLFIKINFDYTELVTKKVITSW